MNGTGIAWRPLTLPLLAALLGACAFHPLTPSPDSATRWTYLGNDPDGTQNIYMRMQSVDKKGAKATGLFRFEFTGPREITGKNLQPIHYVERRDLIEVDCKTQSLNLLDESYHDVDDKEVYHVQPENGGNSAQVFAGGVSDIIYEGACGRSIEWQPLGEDPQKTQDIYARVQDAGGQNAIVKARFRFVYHDPRQMVKAPSLETVTYKSRQASVMVDCADQTVSLLHETYYDVDDVTVFGVTPPKDAHPDSVVPDSVTGMMYKAACGIPLDWTYLGTDPRNTQKVYLLGQPEKHGGGTVEARFRFEYLAPGSLTTGADLKQVQYSVRTADMSFDCGVYSQTLLRESYLDASGKEVFSVKPATPQTVLATPNALSGMIQKAVCR